MPVVDPATILAEIAPENVPLASPPAESNYRAADMQGIACAFCEKFSFTGVRAAQFADTTAEIPVGVCDQWEANVDGVHICDRFASGMPTFDSEGNEQWDFTSADDRVLHEIYMASSPQSESDGLVIKDILRTGEWDATPTDKGKLARKMKIVRDGISNPREGVIAMAELVANFKERVIRRVQIPLSDDDQDHKNITRVNTGFVEDIWIEDGEDGISRLRASMNFTEPDVREKVLRGTYSDVSCGIPLGVKRGAKNYGAVLEHVCITNRPFIDGLGEFIAASDTLGNVDVCHYVLAPEPSPDEPGSIDEPVFLGVRLAQVQDALDVQLGLSNSYRAIDVADDRAVVTNSVAQQTWFVPYTVTDAHTIALAAVPQWAIQQDEGKTDEPPVKAAPRSESIEGKLEQARRARGLRLSLTSDHNEQEDNMPQFAMDLLEGVELSDDQRTALQSVLDDNAALRSRNREGEATLRVEELKALGLSDKPGFLKLYRQVYLADDTQPAVILLSDDGKQKRGLSAVEILDLALDSLKGEDGKVSLSEQHLDTGGQKPPTDASGEQKPLDERVSEAREFLGLKK